MLKKYKLILSLIVSILIPFTFGTSCVLAKSLDTGDQALNETTLDKETTIQLEKIPVELNEEGKEENSTDINETNQNVKTYGANQSSLQPSNVAWSQFWGNGDMSIGDTQSTADGGYIITATYNDLIWLTKINASGAIEWSYSYGDGYKWNVNKVKQTKDLGYILTGSVNEDVFLMKTDTEGSVQWINLFGGDKQDTGVDVVQTIDNGYFIVGNTKSFGNETDDAYVIKTNANGEGEWGGTLPSENSFEVGKHVLIEPSTGNIIVEIYGLKKTDPVNTVFKLSNTGTIITSKSYSNIMKGYATDMILTDDGGLALTGYVSETVNKEYTCYMTLLKLDSSLNIDWQKNYNVNGYEAFQEGESVYQTDDGGFIIAGVLDNYKPEFSADIGLLKINSSCEIEWIQVYSLNDIDGANFVQQTSDSGYVIAGATRNYGIDDNSIFILKLK